MKQWMMSLVLSLGLCGVSMEAGAVSVLVDVDPGNVGFQSMRTVMLGDLFSVDVIVSNLTDTLQGFEFDLAFVAAIVSPNNVSSGGFLTGLAGEISSPTINTTPPEVEFDLTALFTPSNNSTLPLARISFTAVGLGMSDLILNDVILSGTTGPGVIFPISPVPLQNGKITVIDGQQPIPEPGTILLFATGLGGLLLGRRFMNR